MALPDPTQVELGVEYGVNGTSLTGSYNPSPPPPTANATTFVANGDGSYSIVFDSFIGSFAFTQENAILVYMTDTQNWEPVSAGTITGATEITVISPTLNLNGAYITFLSGADGLVFPNGQTLGTVT